MPSSLYLYLQIQRFYLNKEFKKAIIFANKINQFLKVLWG